MIPDDHSDPSGPGREASGGKPRGKTKYDIPSTPDEDTATDERRGKTIRGPEPHDGD